MNSPQWQPANPQLSVLQNWFQSVVTNPESVEAGICSAQAQGLISLKPGELEKVITRSRALTAEERLAIYANAYHHRLFECLGEVFPMLKRTLDEDAFNGLALGYLQHYPSRTYTLNELGRHFPDYLEQTRPASDNDVSKEPNGETDEPASIENWPDFLIDLARLEWGIYEVFDGPGIEGSQLLSASDLTAISAEAWPQMKLRTAVCLRLLKTRFPINDYFSALRQAKVGEAVQIPAAQESFVALTRRDWIVRRHPLSLTQFQLLEALQQGKSVGEAIEEIVAPGAANLDQLAADLRTWFAAWTQNGFFQSVELG
ncbi:MAG TPA: DNA-binding domain-containing protein [Verrucomicrobiae bacterium]|nr:DNA-binding domain-containing protein [Verrucomicrobiae bacterium]